MNAIDARNWFKDVATRLKMLQGGKKHGPFFHNIDEFNQEHSKIDKEQMFLVLDEPKGSLSGQHNENIRDRQRFGFWIYGYVKTNEWEKEDEVYDLAKTAALKVMSKAYRQRKTQNGLFKFVDIDSTDYMKAGPYLTNWFGCYCYFFVSDNANAQIAYNDDDWLPEN